MSHFIRQDILLPYTIHFENETNATAPAQQVFISNRLTNLLDGQTFELTEIAFGDVFIAVPPGTKHFEKTTKMKFNGVDFDVQIEAGIRLATGEVYATFRSIIPTTGLPPAVDTGFLPPENGTGRGMGHIGYTIRAHTNLVTGTEIRNVATIQFDYNPSLRTDLVDPHNPGAGIDTNKQALVTIDGDLPTSSVTSLSPTATNATFTVCWSGSDIGSGIASYDLYVSTNGSATNASWTLWLAGTTANCAAFQGENSRTYCFYSVAHDGSGNVEPAAVTADTCIATGTNYAPTLLPLTTQITFVGKTFFVTNRAFDADLPPQTLTFSLGAGAPTDASINPTNGLFRWQPTREYGSTTNLIRVIVTDIGGLSATGSFVVVIADYLEPGIGGTVVRAGQSTNVPLTIFSSVAVSNPRFTIEYPAGRFSNFTLSNLNPALVSASLQTVTTTQSLVYLTNAAGQSLLGTQQVARLLFFAVSNQASAFVSLLATDLQAKRSDGTNVFSLSDGVGRIAIIGEEPLLEALAATNHQVSLVLYGPTGTTNRIEFATSLPPQGSWLPWQSTVLTNLLQPLPIVSATNQTLFFRAVRQ